MEDLAVVVQVCVVAVAETVAGEARFHVRADNELGAVGKLVQRALYLERIGETFLFS